MYPEVEHDRPSASSTSETMFHRLMPQEEQTASSHDSIPLEPMMNNRFEKLHDSLVLNILNMVSDIKSLGRCALVSKRLSSLIPMVENVTVKVDCVIKTGEEEEEGGGGGGRGVEGDNSVSRRGSSGILSHLCRLVVGSLAKPLQVLLHMLEPKKEEEEEVSGPTTHHSPVEVLKNFKAIRRLRIELPGGELGVENGVLLKWRAEFGSTLESCVILGTSGLVKPGKNLGVSARKPPKFELPRPWFLPNRGEEGIHLRELVAGEEERANHANANDNDNPSDNNARDSSDAMVLQGQDDNGSIPESFYTNGGLKLRVVWTISSLIAASARHYLLQQIICEHPTLQGLIVTDADGQGMLCMGKEQLEEFRVKPLAPSASWDRTQVPALSMKLWYAPYIELPGGTGMEGATLIAIKPSNHPAQQQTPRDLDGFVFGAFEEPFKSAVTLLAKRGTYLLEMNSF